MLPDVLRLFSDLNSLRIESDEPLKLPFHLRKGISHDQRHSAIVQPSPAIQLLTALTALTGDKGQEVSHSEYQKMLLLLLLLKIYPP